MTADDRLRSETARALLDQVRAVLPSTVVGLDFDGTLAPIVDDPDAAYIHPDAAQALLALAGRVRALAIITGRPAEQAVELGGLDDLGARFAERGLELLVFGQYGNQTWSSSAPRVRSAPAPAGLDDFRAELPGLLTELGAAEAFVEEKGIAVGIHTRRLPDPDRTLELLTVPVGELAARHGLSVEPGRQVLEVRGEGMHKGLVVRELVARFDAKGFVYAGDDLGDIEAFDALDEVGGDGLVTLRVFSAHPGEDSPLGRRADLEVDGPDGVLTLLTTLAEPSPSR